MVEQLERVQPREIRRAPEGQLYPSYLTGLVEK